MGSKKTMRKWFISFLLIFVAYVKIPLGLERKYIVINIEAFGDLAELHSWYLLTLVDGRKVYVPTIWTVIEEEDKKRKVDGIYEFPREDPKSHLSHP